MSLKKFNNRHSLRIIPLIYIRATFFDILHGTMQGRFTCPPGIHICPSRNQRRHYSCDTFRGYWSPKEPPTKEASAHRYLAN